MNKNKPNETPFEEKLDAALIAAVPVIKEEMLREFPEITSISDEVLLQTLQGGFKEAWLEANRTGLLDSPSVK
jgi:hypothetical protein